MSIDDIVNKYNNTYYRTIKMKPADGKPSIYINFNKENTMEGSKFKVGENVGIPQCFCKRLYSKLVLISFVVKKVENTIPWIYVISDLNRENIVGTFYKNELQTTNQKEFKLEKVIKRKGNELYVKWNDYDSSFNS